MEGSIQVATLRSMVCPPPCGPWFGHKGAIYFGLDSTPFVPLVSAMQLKLNGVLDSMIQKMGRWSSNTWLQYLHAQILSCLTHGLLACIAGPVL